MLLSYSARGVVVEYKKFLKKKKEKKKRKVFSYIHRLSYTYSERNNNNSDTSHFEF